MDTLILIPINFVTNVEKRDWFVQLVEAVDDVHDAEEDDAQNALDARDEDNVVGSVAPSDYPQVMFLPSLRVGCITLKASPMVLEKVSIMARTCALHSRQTSLKRTIRA